MGSAPRWPGGLAPLCGSTGTLSRGCPGSVAPPVPRAERSGDGQPSSPGSALASAWRLGETGGGCWWPQTAPGDHQGLGAGPLLKAPESPAGTYAATPHPSESPCLSHPDGAGAAPHRAPASRRPWKRADELSCAPAPRARGAGRLLQDKVGCSHQPRASSWGGRAPRGRCWPGPGGSATALQGGGEIPGSSCWGRGVPPWGRGAVGECWAVGSGSRADGPTASHPCWDGWTRRGGGSIRAEGSEAPACSGTLGSCPSVPGPHPCGFPQRCCRFPLPSDRLQLWKSGSKEGNCLSPIREFPLGEPGQADREFPLLPPPLLSPKVTWLPAGKSPSLSPNSTHPVCGNPSCLGVNPRLGKFLGPARPSSPRVLMEPRPRIRGQPRTPRSRHRPCPGVLRAKGPFGVRGACVLWGSKGLPAAPSPATEAPASGTGAWLEPAAPLHPRRRGHGPGAAPGAGGTL